MPDHKYPLWHPMTNMQRFLADDKAALRDGQGNCLVDADGATYLSANSGLWNVSVGFDDHRILGAIRQQLDRLSYGTLYRDTHDPAILLAQRLVDITPEALTRVFYTTSGGSAVDTALKLARRFHVLNGQPNRKTVAALRDSYHGTLYGSMAVTGEDLGQDDYGVDRRYVVHLPTPVTDWQSTIDALNASVAEIGAVIVEPVLGSAGVIVPPQQFFAELNRICKENAILLIVDEVATGFGRTGRMFGFEWFGLEPDMITMSKAMNNGMLPLAAVMVHEGIWQTFLRANADFLHGETQAGNPLACAAALATIEVIEDDRLVERADRIGGHLRHRITDVLGQRWAGVGPVEGLGLMLGLRLRGRDGNLLTWDQLWSVVDSFRQRGVIVSPSPLGISLFPPLTITDGEVDLLVDTIAAVFTEYFGGVD